MNHRRYECETNLCKQKHYHSYFKMEFISRNHFIKSILEKYFSKVYEKIRLLGYQLLSESENEINTFIYSDTIFAIDREIKSRRSNKLMIMDNLKSHA